ncbi:MULTISPECIES: hypothetical protein [unclassified Methanoculleus]|uniref:hypothetical protein n=1 Tax=unclassified Methanoculleus TaxID=2619537 RepID=UPI0025CFFB3B|nr:MULTISPECIES: hypothetical protein [unclassified Methanoculleus]
MAFDSHTTLRNLKRLLPASLIAGLAGGGLLVLLTYSIHGAGVVSPATTTDSSTPSARSRT